MLKQATMVPYDRAVELTDQMRGKFFSSLGAEMVPVSSALNRRLASGVRAVARSPPYNISTMDGYAVDTTGKFPLTLVSEVFAGNGRMHVLRKGETIYVATGAVVPEGAGAVLRIEDATVKDGKIFSDGMPEPDTNIIRAGADFEKGDMILEQGTVVNPSAICVLNAAAVEEASVYRKIKVGVLSTGDEIKNGMARDSNAPMVCAMLENWGCEPVHVGVAPDDADTTKAMLDDAAAKYDVVVTIGGVSVGKKDFVISTVLQYGEVVFHGYKIRPGKPLLVSYYHGKPAFSLPGKPTGAFTAMELILRRFILGDCRRGAAVAILNRDMDLRAEGFGYVVYVQLKDGKAVPMGYEDSPLKLFPGPGYKVSVVSSSPRAIVADGFFMAGGDLKAGQSVLVNLL